MGLVMNKHMPVRVPRKPRHHAEVVSVVPTSSPPPLKTIHVRIPGRTEHDIIVGTDILRELPKRITKLKLSRSALIISNPTIIDDYGYGADVANVLRDDGFDIVKFATFPDGEEYKTLQSWQDLLIAANKIEEQSETRLLFINLGGGVVGDVGAFAAACYGRGRDYIQIPTTLLGHVDCGIGGKCAINFTFGEGEAKNLIGVFYQPRLVLVDLKFLKTLPAYEVRSGLAEIIKYGMIADPKLFAYVETNLDDILACKLAVLEPVVEKCLKLKVDVVQRDEMDKLGIRAHLNFGHTIGHALETATNYRLYSHGEAISVGMLCACEIAEKFEMIDPSVTKRLEALLKRAELPTRMSAQADVVLDAMKHDKKFKAGVNEFVLPTALGNVTIKKAIPIDIIRSVVEGRIA
jgi:3-dehydroquinate synthase